MAAMEAFGKNGTGRTASPADSDSLPAQENEKMGIDGSREDEDAISPDLEMTPEEYKVILRKLDFAIIPYCTLLYLLR